MEIEKKISACGLYCGECRAFKKGKCPGCSLKTDATWCKVRTCCKEHNWISCAECTETGIDACKKYNNFMTSFFKFVFRSDRHGCIRRIQKIGYENFAIEMESSHTYNRPAKQE